MPLEWYKCFGFRPCIGMFSHSSLDVVRNLDSYFQLLSFPTKLKPGLQGQVFLEVCQIATFYLVVLIKKPFKFFSRQVHAQAPLLKNKHASF